MIKKQWKTYDALVGDVTILANRTKYVEFTQGQSLATKLVVALDYKLT